MSALEVVLIGLRWSFLGVIYFGISLIAVIIFGNVVRYGRGDRND